MSVIASFKSILPEKLEEIKENPELIEKVLYPEEGDSEDSVQDDMLDIDKAWEGIHLLLTGSDIEGGDFPLA